MTEATTSLPSDAAPSAVSEKTAGPGGGRRVLVTGGSRGIGFAVAKRLAEEGYVVAVNGRNADRAAQAAAKLCELGYEAYALPFDVTDRKTAADVLAADVTERGAFWGVVLNAGINRDMPLAAMSDDDWDTVVNTDLGGFYNVLRPLVMTMARARKGRIVVVSSVSGMVGTRGQTNYSAAKAGLIGASKALAMELASRSITVNVIAPGLIDTDMVTDEDRERILPLIPMRRLGNPEEVANVAAFLLSDGAAYVTRAVIPVAGGLV